MANERYPVKTVGGSEILPIADAVLYTDSMSASSANACQVYMEFFSDSAGTVVDSPSAGVISAQISPMGSVWLEPTNHGVVNASDVKPSGAYIPPVFDGRADKGRVTLAGIAGALTARITFWRY